MCGEIFPYTMGCITLDEKVCQSAYPSGTGIQIHTRSTTRTGDMLILTMCRVEKGAPRRGAPLALSIYGISPT